MAEGKLGKKEWFYFVSVAVFYGLAIWEKVKYKMGYGGNEKAFRKDSGF